MSAIRDDALKMGVRELDLVTQYTVHPYDEVLGLYFAQARMYDAGDSRFAAADPVKGTTANALTLVQYTYVLDNPRVWVDLLGLEGEYLLVDGKPVYISDRSYVGRGYVQLSELVSILNNNAISASTESLNKRTFGSVNGNNYSIGWGNYTPRRSGQISSTGYVMKGYRPGGYFQALLCLDNNEAYVQLEDFINAAGLYGQVKFATESEVAIGYIKALTELAKEYGSVGWDENKTRVNWYVAMYIRQNEPDYTDGNWAMVGGEIDQAFIAAAFADYLYGLTAG